MQSETKYTKQDLETMRAWSLQRKIQVTQTRIIEWIGRYDWNVYISFSGGKDSTVLADLTARAYQALIMRLIRGYSWTKISGKLGVPDSTARNWHGRAVERLGEVLEEVPMVDELAERATRARTYA